MDKYNHKKIEKKWQDFWKKNQGLFSAENDSKKPKKYVLDMFPYPSGEGLHVGHVESYTATDILSRYYRMNGFDVLHPQGWDAFGLPAENYAIKTGTHPSETTKRAIENFTRQINSMGFSYDWSCEVNTSSPEYYKWTQWFFLLLYKNDLAYKEKAKVNWCDSCKTVLANEQVESGLCERCKSEVIQKDLEQWFFKITDFLEDSKKTSGLLSGLDKVDWPESTKASQRNWIGKSEGVEFEMKIEGTDEKVDFYTTRIDTVFGVTYAVIAPEHPIVEKLRGKIENFDEVSKYIEEAKGKTELERSEQKEKTGVELKGVRIINPFNNEPVPLYVGDYVLVQYGTGAVMAVPAHDERDWEFAKKYNLPIKQVIAPYNLDEKNPPQDGKKDTIREVVHVILENSEGKVLTLHLKEDAWGDEKPKTFVIGGIEDGEGVEDAAKREIEEETGYSDFEITQVYPIKFHAEFFAAHKDVNRYVKTTGVFCKLNSDKQSEILEEEKEKHDIVWVSKDNVVKSVTIPDDKFFAKAYLEKTEAYTDSGVLIGSGEFDGLNSAEARRRMDHWLKKEGIGKKKVNYRIRDWLVSRQRYWGAPIPIIHCQVCGEVPVPEKDLPVKLPTDVDFRPTGESPLVRSESFHSVKCPECGKDARREADTMDTFVCSSWYYFRYSDPKNENEFASKDKLKKWLPVDIYVGGAEHTVLHLLYSRFFTKVLHNLGYIGFDEPFLKLRHQGIILAEDGKKMSKSLGNVVNPDDVVKEVGADALRMFEMFMGPLEDMKPWNTQGIVGIIRFLEKVFKLSDKAEDLKDNSGGKGKKIETLLHKTIKKVTEDVESLRFNTAISALMILVNEMEKQEKLSAIDYKSLIIILSPFAPHLAEELWEKLGNKGSIFNESWPKHDENLIKEVEVELVIQVNGKVRDKIIMPANTNEESAKTKALESEKVRAHTQGKEIKKVIFVPERLINIVVN